MWGLRADEVPTDTSPHTRQRHHAEQQTEPSTIREPSGFQIKAATLERLVHGFCVPPLGIPVGGRRPPAMVGQVEDLAVEVLVRKNTHPHAIEGLT